MQVVLYQGRQIGNVFCYVLGKYKTGKGIIDHLSKVSTNRGSLGLGLANIERFASVCTCLVHQAPEREVWSTA